MKKNTKRLISLLLIIAVTLMTVACEGTGNGDSETDGSAGGTNTVTVSSPITIEFWHTFGSGPQAEYMKDAIKRFNETNEYDITVNATYIGAYGTVRSQLTTSIGAGDNPQIAVLGMSDILASAGVLADMSAYAERDKVDMDDFIDGVQTSMYYEEQLTAFPFLRSCPLFYYNVDMFKNAGHTTPPNTIDEMEQMCRDVANKTGKKGFEMMVEVSFVQEALLRSLGSEGYIDKDQKGSSCIEDGTLLKIMTDWKRWCDEGWCVTPPVTDVTNGMLQAVYTGELASCIASSASLSTIIGYAQESGQNIAVAPMPGYDGKTHGVGGGGDISIISANNDDQQIAASWEFVKFMMSSEEIANRSKATGYLPTTNSSLELMADYFEEEPNMKIASEARAYCEDVVGCAAGSEWQTQIGTAISYVIQDKSKTPEEAIEYLETLYPTVFY